MSRLSSIEWELAIIAAIILVVPAGMVFAEGVFSADEESESYFNPHTIEDFDNPDVGPYMSESRTSDYLNFRYYNETGSINNVRSSGLYTTNVTGNEYHEFLASQDEDNDGTYDTFNLLSITLNQTIDDLIEDDLSSVSVTAEFPRNTTLDFEGYIHHYEDTNDRYELFSENKSVGPDMTEYTFDIDYSKLLDADSQIGDADSTLGILIGRNDDMEYDVEPIQPGDSLMFNIDLMSDYTASPLITTNFFAGLMGGISLLAAVFTSPWIDFRDVYGPLLEAIK